MASKVFALTGCHDIRIVGEQGMYRAALEGVHWCKVLVFPTSYGCVGKLLGNSLDLLNSLFFITADVDAYIALVARLAAIDGIDDGLK